MLFFGGLVPLAQFIPPPSPLLSGEELMTALFPRLGYVKAGIIVGLLGSCLLVPWSAMVSLQVARMEQGRRYPLWALFSFGAGMVNAVAFILPFIFWAGAFYRPDRSPELVQLINDMTWLEFLLFFPTFSFQLFCVAMAGLTQRQGPKVFPRWFLYLNLWMALIGSTGMLCIFFFSGPFAWNGIIGFYIPVGSYVPFLLITYVQFYKAIVSEPSCYEASGQPAA